MTTAAEYQDFLRRRVATGYIVNFYLQNIATINLNLEQTFSGGVHNGRTIKIVPQAQAIVSNEIQSGLLRLPGGGILNPWGTADMRAPTSYPAYTQTFLYTGHVEVVQDYYGALLGAVGLTGSIRFSYGYKSSTAFGEKYCPAQLLSVRSETDRTLKVGSSLRTHLIITATWQQTGDLTW